MALWIVKYAEINEATLFTRNTKDIPWKTKATMPTITIAFCAHTPYLCVTFQIKLISNSLKTFRAINASVINYLSHAHENTRTFPSV